MRLAWQRVGVPLLSPRQAVIAVIIVSGAVLAGELFLGASPILKGIGILAKEFGEADLTVLGAVFGGVLGSAVAIIIPLAVSRSRSRSARNAGDAAAAHMASAHYPRSRLLRGLWPGADRRYTP
jgi:hypothetical protein